MPIRGIDYFGIKSWLNKILPWGNVMAFIKKDKLSRICGIYEKKGQLVTPPAYRQTLSMFQGQQLTKEKIKEVFNYLNLSVKAQEGDVEAAKSMSEYHYQLNHRA